MTAHALPPANLKERIAALQQRGTSPQPASVKPESTPSPKGSLRDKIAKFERKGGMPVPRSSFGMGAPPIAEDRAASKAQFYGNRMPSIGSKTPGHQVQSRSNSLSLLSNSPSLKERVPLSLSSPDSSDAAIAPFSESGAGFDSPLDSQASVVAGGAEINGDDNHSNNATDSSLHHIEATSPMADTISLLIVESPSVTGPKNSTETAEHVELKLAEVVESETVGGTIVVAVAAEVSSKPTQAARGLTKVATKPEGTFSAQRKSFAEVREPSDSSAHTGIVETPAQEASSAGQPERSMNGAPVTLRDIPHKSHSGIPISKDKAASQSTSTSPHVLQKNVKLGNQESDNATEFSLQAPFSIQSLVVPVVVGADSKQSQIPSSTLFQETPKLSSDPVATVKIELGRNGFPAVALPVIEDKSSVSPERNDYDDVRSPIDAPSQRIIVRSQPSDKLNTRPGDFEVNSVIQAAVATPVSETISQKIFTPGVSVNGLADRSPLVQRTLSPVLIPPPIVVQPYAEPSIESKSNSSLPRTPHTRMASSASVFGDAGQFATVPRTRSTLSPSPDSPPFLDLSLLVAQAALLEEQLGDVRTQPASSSPIAADAGSSLSPVAESPKNEHRNKTDFPPARPRPTMDKLAESVPPAKAPWRNTFHAGMRRDHKMPWPSESAVAEKLSMDSFDLVTPPLYNGETTPSSSAGSFWSLPKKSAKKAISRSNTLVNKMFSRASRSSASLSLHDEPDEQPVRMPTIPSFTPLTLSVEEESVRPLSAASTGSSETSSLATPIFGQHLFDAFPAVPETTSYLNLTVSSPQSVENSRQQSQSFKSSTSTLPLRSTSPYHTN